MEMDRFACFLGGAGVILVAFYFCVIFRLLCRKPDDEVEDALPTRARWVVEHYAWANRGNLPPGCVPFATDTEGGVSTIITRRRIIEQQTANGEWVEWTP